MRLKKEANDRARLEEKKRKEALKREERKRGALMEKVEDVPARQIKMYLKILKSVSNIKTR